MYPSGLDGTNTHDLRQEVPTGDFHYQKIPNGLVDFADGGYGRAPNDKRAIACIVLYIFGANVKR